MKRPPLLNLFAVISVLTAFVEYARAQTDIFTGNSTYTGPTSVLSSHTLQLGNGGTTGSIASSSILNSGALAFDRSDAGAVIMGVISGSGAVNQIGTGLTTLTGNNTYSGATTITSGTLQIGAGGTTGSITTTSIVDNAALVL